MSVDNRFDVYQLAGQLHLTVAHYARGTYPIFGDEKIKLSVNRLFCVLQNPNGANNYLRDDRTRIELLPGRICFIPAEYPAVIRLDDCLRFVSIQFNLEFYPGLDLFSSLRWLHFWDRPDLVSTLDAEFDIADIPGAAARLQRHTWELIGEIFALGDDSWQSAGKFSGYLPLLDYILKHASAQLQVSVLATVMHMSYSTFHRRFTADTGEEPKRFLDRQLAKIASARLLTPQITVREVAAEMEFSSEYVFSRFFRRQTGLPPGEFQKRHRL